MPTTSVKNDARYEKAARRWLEIPALKCPEVMKISGFSAEEVKNNTICQRVRRMKASIEESIERGLIPPIVASLPKSKDSDCSPLTDDTSLSVSKNGSSTTSAASLPSNNSLKKKLGVKQIRKTSVQAHQNRVNKKKISDNEKEAFKQATILYASQKKKAGGRWSAKRCADHVNENFGANVTEDKIRRYVNNGKVGESPATMGPSKPNGIPEHIYKLVAGAFTSYVGIQQANGEKVTRKDLIHQVNDVVKVVSLGSAHSPKLLDRLLPTTATNLQGGYEKKAEDRRIRWTTYSNLKLWFDNWKRELLELGFATTSQYEGEEGEDEEKINIPVNQLDRILNLDETCLSLDGSQGARGGRPTVSYFYPSLPQLGQAASKSNVTTTLICGSTAGGEALPPHFQFSTKAKSEETMRLRRDTVVHMRQVRGKFGNKTTNLFPVTIGMNEKGGMDDEEFHKYIMNSIVPLYPDVSNKKGKRVLIKIDSGPGRTNPELLASLRTMGFVLYPGVPNTTAVSQETDQGYGLFKSLFRETLDKITADRKRQNKSVSFPPSLCGLFVFGGTDHETNISGYKNAFEIAFSKEKCLASWAKVRAAPLTMACLHSSKVRHEIGEDEGEGNTNATLEEMKRLQAQNDMCVSLLCSKGYDGKQLEAKLPEKHEEAAVALTVPHSQERVDAIMTCKTHGQSFQATGGMPLTGDEIFLAAEQEQKAILIKKMKDDKANRIAAEQRETAALKIIEKEESNNTLNGNDLDVLLKWYNVKLTGLKKAEKLSKWKEIREKSTPPPSYLRWTAEDEENLKAKEDGPVRLADTSLGRFQARKRKEMEESFRSGSREEREDFIKRLKEIAEEEE